MKMDGKKSKKWIQALQKVTEKMHTDRKAETETHDCTSDKEGISDAANKVYTEVTLRTLNSVLSILYACLRNT
jgi:hypothetical protein